MQTIALERKRKERSPLSDVTIKRHRVKKGVSMPSQYQRMEGFKHLKNSNTLLPPTLPPGANSNAEAIGNTTRRRRRVL